MTSPAREPRTAETRPKKESLPPAEALTRSAPFLLWPVSRREFYRTIAFALIPSIFWAFIIYGFRVFITLTASLLAASITHTLLKRFTGWYRGKSLLYAHTVVTVIVLVALAQPSWPAWVLTATALLIPFFIALVGGPGREPVHLAVLCIFLLQFIFIPQLPRLHTYAGGPDAILARDRLLMGDLRSQRPSPVFEWPIDWPISRELSGDDAVVVPTPGRIATETLNEISDQLAAPAALNSAGALSETTLSRIRNTLDHAFAHQFPPMDDFLLGAVPGRIGCVCVAAIFAAGLYLAYRYILRPRSAVFFAAAYIFACALFAFTPAALAHIHFPGLLQFIVNFPAELLTLFEYLLFSSDAPFAAVFILALPGTEPLTTRGRRPYLLLAAILSAYLHRIEPALPAASLMLTALMPFAPLFDRFLAKPSWLNPR